MKTVDLLSEMNIHLNDVSNNLFDYIQKYENITALDIFPKTISNNKKYQSVEVFYQRLLNRSMKKQEFETIEKHFIDFVMTLWLYNETYVNFLSSKIISNYYYKKNKKVFKKHSKVLMEANSNADEFLLIEDKDLLSSISILATRDITPVIFYFKNSKILLLLSGCFGLIYYGSSRDTLLTKQIADNCSLYLYKN